MALANETLKQQMEKLPAGHFDIESIEEAEKVIAMVRPGHMVSGVKPVSWPRLLIAHWLSSSSQMEACVIQYSFMNICAGWSTDMEKKLQTEQSYYWVLATGGWASIIICC